MNSLRKVLGFLVAAVMLAAFAPTASADGSDEKFTFVVPTTASVGVNASFVATLSTQVGDDDRIKSFRIYAPAGVTINSATTSPASTVTGLPGNVLNVRNTNLSRNARTITVTMNVTFPSSGCTANGYTWNAKAYEDTNWSDGRYVMTGSPPGSFPSNVLTTVTPACYTLTYAAGAGGSIVGTTPQNVSPGGSGSAVTAQANALFTFTSWSDGSTANPRADTNVTGNINVTANFAPNKLTITSKPTSAALNAPFDVTVGINPGPATVTADTSACGSASVSTKSSTTTSTTLTFTIPAGASITACTLAFSATNYSSPPSVNLKVLAGQTNACAAPSAPPPPGSQFTASCATGGINVTGFAAGVRGPNKTGPCDPLNFTLTNNICGTAVQQDANGNFIPPNAVSFVWDQLSQSAAFTYTVTWKAEYVDPATGLPALGRTKYCTGTDPNNPCATMQTLKACMSPLVAFGSIPSGEPACNSEEDWATVSQTECAGLTNPNGDNPPPACIRATTTIIDAKDPPIIRN